MSADYVAESAETLAGVIRAVTDLWDEPLDEVHDVPQIVNALIASGAIRPAAQVRAEALRPVLALADEWEQEADEDERALNGPHVAVSEAREYPVTIRQARAHAADLRAALAREDVERVVAEQERITGLSRIQIAEIQEAVQDDA